MSCHIVIVSDIIIGAIPRERARKWRIMAVGTRTAPTVAIANINKSVTTFHLVDASGDTFTDAIVTPDLVSDGLVEAIAAAYQAASQASLWKVSQTIEYIGDQDTSNGGIGQRNSIAEGVNNLYKNLTTLQSQTPRLVAPIDAVMQGNQDIPLLSSTEMAALITATLAVLSGYSHASAQFTGRRERTNNPRIKS